MGRKIAIVGMSPSSVECPVDDPEWEIWGLPWDKRRIGNASRFFEVHTPEDWGHYATWGGKERYVKEHPEATPAEVEAALPEYNRRNYRRHLRTLTAPIYMQEAHDDIPQSVAYPIEAMIPSNGEAPVGGISRDYFGSTIAYMLALAWLERVAMVGVWGVELSQADYHHQRPNLEYWIGRLEERGTPVDVIGPRGFLLKLVAHPAHNGKRYKRYAWIEE